MKNQIDNTLRCKVRLKLITGVVGAGLFLMATSAPVTAQDQPFGTARKPQTCPDRSAPKKGAISAQQATIYYSCWVEKVIVAGTKNVPQYLILLANVDLKVAGKARQATAYDVGRAANLIKVTLNQAKPVYDIRANYSNYFCSNPSVARTFKVGANCSRTDHTATKGVCFQDSFDDWYCVLQGGSSKRTQQVAPPQ